MAEDRKHIDQKSPVSTAANLWFDYLDKLGSQGVDLVRSFKNDMSNHTLIGHLVLRDDSQKVI